MTVWRGIGLGLVVLGLCTVRSTGGGDAVTPSPAQDGMQAHIDPQTGRRVSEPVTRVPAALPAPLPHLAEVPAPGGGMMVYMDGRFMNTLVATVDDHGDVHVGCVTEDGDTVDPKH